MMKWLHLPWHIEGNRVVKTVTDETLVRFAPSSIPVEEHRGLQFACDEMAYSPGRDPWILLGDVLQLILANGYTPTAA